jgi:hypothetical protein
MKSWIITLPFLCATGVAMAQGFEMDGDAGRPRTAPAEPVVVPAEIATPDEAAVAPAAKAPAKAKSKSRAKRGPKTLPTGDIRHCLDLKTDAQIIRCSEDRRRK